MFICFLLHSCIFTLIHTLSTRGRRSELNAKFRNMHLKFGTLHPHVQGSLHLFRGSFLAVFNVEFVLCSACDLSLPFIGFGHELSFFVFLSSYFPSLNFISCCVLSMHSSRGGLRTRSVPVVDG
jgi:hypothetical protein